MGIPTTVPEDYSLGPSFTSIEVRGRWSLATVRSIARPPGRDGFAEACALGRGAPSKNGVYPVSAA
jgi:hypothetical protein